MSLEERVAAIEERLNMESGLRASADRDLSDFSQTLRAQHHLIQALSITQGQHTDALREHGELLGRHSQSLGAAHRKLDQIIGMLGQMINRDHTEPDVA